MARGSRASWAVMMGEEAGVFQAQGAVVWAVGWSLVSTAWAGGQGESMK